ncbi:MAG: protoporphyrinogen oxidase HemJ [Gammaproteobacteria bacterium]|nr:protoporphyrinogen oxidase HemJ [Gammaproteobacteria bacterium]
MLWFKAFHIIFVVTWFSGLFYLPRLFVYHASVQDSISDARFKIMERKLYYGITMPSAILATLFGIILLSYSFSGYLQLGWMHLKLGLVVLLWLYQFICGKYVQNFKKNLNKHSATFYRFFNEIPVLFLVAIIILVVVKPSF